MTRSTFLNRRGVLSLLAAGAASPLLPTSVFAAKIDTLALFGPPAGPSVTLSYAVASGAFNNIASKATFKAWRNPDELRAGLTSGEIGLSVVPVQAAANLFNRGFPIRLANVMTNGLLYIISEDDGISEILMLAGSSAFAGAGLILAGSARLDAPWSELTGLHAAFLGGLGLGVYAVFCIAGKLHTNHQFGQSLIVRTGAILLCLSAILRILPEFGFELPGPYHGISVLLWSSAFLLWLYDFWPILIRIETDARTLSTPLAANEDKHEPKVSVFQSDGSGTSEHDAPDAEYPIKSRR